MVVNNLFNKNTIIKNITKNINIENIYIFETIDSTNSYSKALNITADHYSLVISHQQTNGRGRLGRNFYSPKSTGIYMSIIYKNKNTINPVNITSIAAVAVAKAIEKLTNINVKIKWVNDLYIDDKKFCGILTECTNNIDTGLIENIIVGIGINVSTKSFPNELKDIATSLNVEVDKNLIISEIVNYLHYYLTHGKEYLDLYRSKSMVIGKEVNYYQNDKIFSGKCIGINDEGELIIEKENAVIDVLRTGEITLRLKK